MVNARKAAKFDGTNGDPTVVAFDPGGVTGWAVVSVHPVAVLDPAYPITTNITHLAVGHFNGSEFDQVESMLQLCEDWLGCAKVTENFILMTSNTGEALLAPVRINAAFRYGLGRKARLWRQNPALAKTTITDDRLKIMGLYEQTVGKEHGRDALRHALTFWKRIKTQPALRKEVFPSLR